MNTTSWLGLGFVVFLVLLGAVAVGATLRQIRRAQLDDREKSRWGLLIGAAPWAGLYAWHRRDELMGHGDDHGDDPESDAAEPR